MAMNDQADMVLELLQAIRDSEPKAPARLSPLTEHAYTQAEATLRRQQIDEVA